LWLPELSFFFSKVTTGKFTAKLRHVKTIFT